jgi:N-acetylglutamate synthase-like GNAT family acetyltransferase
MIEIWTKSETDVPWISTLLRKYQASPEVSGRLSLAAHLSGYIAYLDDQRAGLVTYRFQERECEIVTLISTVTGRGVGCALIEETRRTAQITGCERLWTIITNDQLSCLGFLQKRGFNMVRLFRNTFVPSDDLTGFKTGEDGIPIRDQIELELPLEGYARSSTKAGRFARLIKPKRFDRQLASRESSEHLPQHSR